LAATLERGGRRRDELRVHRAILARDPADVDSARRAERLLGGDGRWAEAVAVWQAVLAFHPANEAALERLPRLTEKAARIEQTVQAARSGLAARRGTAPGVIGAATDEGAKVDELVVLLADASPRLEAQVRMMLEPTRFDGSYYDSSHWRTLTARLKWEADDTCVECGTRQAWLETHHLSYQRLGAEIDTDLVVLCPPCHRRRHARDDPVVPPANDGDIDIPF
jgi:hypothetical protein